MAWNRASLSRSFVSMSIRSLMSRDTAINREISPDGSRTGDTVTSHQRGAPLAVGQKAWNRCGLPSSPAAIA